MSVNKVIEIGNGNGIELSEYNGTFSLISCRESNGTMYQQWAKYRVAKDKFADKEWPVKVTLGDKKEAISALTELLQMLGGRQEQGEVEDDIPI